MATTSYGTPYVQSSDLVSGWPNASLNVANRIDEVSYAGNGINAQTVTSYTLVVGDAGKTVTLSNAAAVAVTLPQDSTANLPTGAVVNFYNLGAGAVTISAGAGATLQGGSLTATQYQYAAVIKLSANTYGPYQPVPTAPALVYITQATATSAATLSVNSCFSSTYENYLLRITKLVGSGGNAFNMRLRASGTDAASAYAFQFLDVNGTSVSASRSTSQNEGRIATIRTDSNGGCIDVYIFGPNLAAATNYSTGNNYDSENGAHLGVFVGTHSTASAYDGFTLLQPSGTFSGTVRVYGFKNS